MLTTVLFSVLPGFRRDAVLVIIEKDLVGGPLQIIELVVAHRPDEYPDGDRQKNQ